MSEEGYVYPPDLFGGSGDWDRSLQWRVAYTKPRQEKAISRELLGAEISYFLPCARQDNDASRRIPASFLPVFPGYIFLRIPDAKAVPNRTRDRIVRLLEVSDQDRICDELRRVWWLLGAEANVRTEELYEPGSPVEIRMGPMAGLRGVLVERKNETRFVVQVDFIQKGISLVVDRNSLNFL